MGIIENLENKFLFRREDLLQAFRDLIKFAKNPIQTMKDLPHWGWAVLVIVHIALTSAFGFLVGVFSFSIVGFIGSLILFPITSAILITVLTGFFYYTFLFFFNQEYELKKIVIILFFAHLPNVVLSPFMNFLPPLGILAILAGALLLIVGFSENLNVNRKMITRIVSGMVVIYIVFWIINMISFNQEKKAYRDLTSPETLNILEKEFGGDTENQD